MYQLQDLMSLLEGYNLQSPYNPGTVGGLESIAPWQIQQSMTEMFGFDPSILTNDLFPRITSTDMYGLLGKDYSPGIQSDIQKHAGTMKQSFGTMGRKAAGGFAESQQYEDFAGGVRDEYGRVAGDILGNVQASKSQSIGNLMDKIMGFKQTASQFI